MFNRTTAGLINKYLFYPEPIIWVEGKDDFPFYSPITKELGCRIEPAGGKYECMRLAEAIILRNLPFVVVLDGDYDILVGQKYIHNRIVYLRKYAIENYLFERILVQNICCKYERNEKDYELFGELFDEIDDDLRRNLYELLILDYANYVEDTGLNVFPDTAEKVIDIILVHCIPERITAICQDISKRISTEAIEKSRAIIDNYLLHGRFSDLVMGHFIFGILRHLICRGAKMVNRRNPNIDNDSLYIMLPLELWSTKPSEHHLILVREIQNAVDDARKIKMSILHSLP